MAALSAVVRGWPTDGVILEGLDDPPDEHAFLVRRRMSMFDRSAVCFWRFPLNHKVSKLDIDRSQSQRVADDAHR